MRNKCVEMRKETNWCQSVLKCVCIFSSERAGDTHLKEIREQMFLLCNNCCDDIDKNEQMCYNIDTVKKQRRFK